MLKTYLLLLLSGIAQRQGALALTPEPERMLFICNSESGLGNAVLATSHSVLLNYPEVQVHFASFPRYESHVAAVSKYGTASSPAARPITFHTLHGTPYYASVKKQGLSTERVMVEPGAKGMAAFHDYVPILISPWTGEEYVELQKEFRDLFAAVKPTVVVMDAILAPAFDVAQSMGLKYLSISPNSLMDIFASKQPYAAMLWKYPAMNSAHPYPVPWRLIPSNIIYMLRLIWNVVRSPIVRDKKAYIREHGIAAPSDALTPLRDDVPWISAGAPEIEYPIILPPNAVAAGPIYLSLAPVSERDPDLAKWLAQAPTVMINLGSMFRYAESDAIETAGAIVHLLLQDPRVQVIWKLYRRTPFDDSFQKPLDEFIRVGRVRITDWISVDPATLLESGNVVLSVHHGGANCFLEALATGIPSVILPLWADLYDYAVRSEWLGVGIWPNRDTAPAWNASTLGTAMLRGIGDGEEAVQLRRRAKEVAAQIAKRGRGRDIAARAIIEYMRGVNASQIAVVALGKASVTEVKDEL